MCYQQYLDMDSTLEGQMPALPYEEVQGQDRQHALYRLPAQDGKSYWGCHCDMVLELTWVWVLGTGADMGVGTGYWS